MGWIPIHVGVTPTLVYIALTGHWITLRSSSARLLPKGRKKGFNNLAQGRWWGVGIPFVGSRPYANIYCPYRASITLKGFNNLAQGLAPGYTNVYKIKNAPNGG